jgi:hypothetical protein
MALLPTVVMMTLARKKAPCRAVADLFFFPIEIDQEDPKVGEGDTHM